MEELLRSCQEINSGPIILDGAMGSLLQEKYPEMFECA